MWDGNGVTQSVISEAVTIDAPLQDPDRKLMPLPLTDELDALDDESTRVGFAGRLYSILRDVAHSAGTVLGTAAARSTGATDGDVVLLDSSGEIPSSLIESDDGPTVATPGQPVITGEGAGISALRLIGEIRNDTDILLALSIYRAPLVVVVPEDPNTPGGGTNPLIPGG